MENIFYLASILDNIKVLSIIALIVGIAFILGVGIAYLVEGEFFDDDEKIRYKRLLKTGFITTIVSALVVTFVPDEKTYYLMKGADALEDVANNEKVQEVAGKTLELFIGKVIRPSLSTKISMSDIAALIHKNAVSRVWSVQTERHILRIKRNHKLPHNTVTPERLSGSVIVNRFT